MKQWRLLSLYGAEVMVEISALAYSHYWLRFIVYYCGWDRKTGGLMLSICAFTLPAAKYLASYLANGLVVGVYDKITYLATLKNTY